MLALRYALFAWQARSHDLHKATARTLGKCLWRAPSLSSFGPLPRIALEVAPRRRAAKEKDGFAV